MNVSDLKKILEHMEMDGQGNKPVFFGYDSDFAFTQPNGVYTIKENGVYFYEKDKYDSNSNKNNQ